MSSLPGPATHVPHQCAVAGYTWHERGGSYSCQYCHRPVNVPPQDSHSSFPNSYTHGPQYSDSTCPSNHVYAAPYYPTAARSYDRRHWDLPVRESIGFDHQQPNGQYEYHPPYSNQFPPTLPSISPIMQYDASSLESHVQPLPKQSSRGQERRGSNQTSNGKVQCEICKGQGKESFFGRDADKTRHIDSVHNKDKRWDCPYSSCERKDEKGFTRKDHMKDHIRQVHNKDLPKKRVNRTKKGSDDGLGMEG